jgi:threonine/homoserine/homoserine lactone efflux protein
MWYELLALGFIVWASFGPVNPFILQQSFANNNVFYAATGAILGDAVLLMFSKYASSAIMTLLQGVAEYLVLLLAVILLCISISSFSSRKKRSIFKMIPMCSWLHLP